MKVFVTGGTGVLGAPTIRLLRERGHDVRALAHSAGSVERLRALGAEPAPGDLFNPASLRSAMAGSDAIVHVATRIPPASRMGRLAAWVENDRIRREGTRNLVEAALAEDVGAFVYESIVLVYADAGDRWIDAQNGNVEPVAQVPSTLDAEREVTRFAAAGRRGVSLRLGLLYSPDDEGTLAQRSMARLGIAAVFGPGDAYWPSLWIDDAAAAFVAAVEQAPSGVFDVVDDRPVRRSELVQAMSAAVDRRLWRLPGIVERVMLSQVRPVLTRSQRVSNRRFVEATGWQPSVPDAFEGWRRIAAGAASPMAAAGAH